MNGLYFEDIEHVYFIGIGGIGMSALARYFKAQGKSVSGYDKTSTELTNELIDEGMEVHFTDDIHRVSASVRNALFAVHNTLVVFTPAIPKDHQELNYFIDNNFMVKKRSEVLGLITEGSFTIAVAGTHGKTTTSSMIAHILRSAGVNSTAFLGGISKNYHSNLIVSKDDSKKNIFVVEADEYDRSFLTLHPDIAVITSMDADHLDVYGDKKFLEDSYRLFARQLKPGGKLIYKKDLPLGDLDLPHAEYSLTGNGDYSASGIRIDRHRYHFNWNNSSSSIPDLSSEMPGLHNVENAVAAIAAAKQLGISSEKISEAIHSYKGVKRRFDYQFQNEQVVYIDDYAHHPEELRACISSVRELYPGKKITGIFQPHLYSRTRDFAVGFAKSLSLLDALILLDIYPARELPIEGVTSQMIFEKISIPDKIICSKEEVLDELKKRNPDVLLTLGAGDIDQLVSPVRHYLEKKYADV
ncbi:MAG: UDP-N-acetylmuramate--L-alanine ligase [Bacteroidetes bacterium]|nr:UDP-N-acetylmuramate--L-alanine ligase [Bacteroidota bacterium]